ncbi:hypothetical protein FRC07_005082 [Ceratobasidium sp. 392]|nr:hypothetical protein FRC07_005082 [Ceratobasidium sp. 392]
MSRKKIRSESGFYYGSFEFTQPLSQANFGRFNIYAPYVKHLDLFRRSKYLKLVSGWNILIDYVNSGHVLLSNLVALDLQSPNGTYCKIFPYLWVLSFCSPKLESISIDRRLGPISPCIGSALLQLLVDKCPSLSNLDFRLTDHDFESEQDEFILPRSKTTDLIPNLLSPNSTLQHLSVSMYFGDKYLSLIGDMKNLQCLELHDDCTSVLTLVKPPPGSFPMLAALKLDYFGISAANFILANMPNLVSKVTTLKCAFYETGEDDIHLPVSSTPSRFVAALNECCPHITDLSLHFDPEDYAEGSYNETMNESTLLLLAKLPLRRLSIEAAAISPYAHLKQTTSACQLLTTIFPGLEVLRWMSQRANYEDLYLFKDMPNLIHLGLRLNGKPMSGSIFANRPSDMTTSANSILRVLETDIKNIARCTYSDDSRFMCARYLAGIWPNVQVIPHFRATSIRNYDEERINDNQYELMNKFISLLRYKDPHDGQTEYEFWRNTTAGWNAAIFPSSRPEDDD